ncbi:MAG: type II secretion system protein [Sporichthyaceae bacterium]
MPHSTEDRGFTLIEILVVIVIIGVLAAVAIPVFLSQRKKAFEAGEKSDARAIATQLESYYADAQAYPASLPLTGDRIAFATPDPDDVEEVVVLSPNNTAAVYLSAAGASYCVVVGNANADRTAIWNSLAGGLQPVGTQDCGVEFTSANLVG